MIVDMLSQDDMDFGIEVFDQLQRNQKLAILYRAARALLHPDESVIKLTAFVEAAVAVVYEHAKDMVDQEIDEPGIFGESAFWRTQILDAVCEGVHPDELPEVSDDSKEIWHFMIELLAGSVLWDDDYASDQCLDLPPEEAKQHREELGITDDYYTDIPPDPPDDQLDLYLDALRGLTIDVR
jgi:hypothetical protein